MRPAHLSNLFSACINIHKQYMQRRAYTSLSTSHPKDTAMNLSKVDLNLFIVFDAIYTEANLTRAGQIVGITQPAVSNALARLRDTFNDPLFVRTAQGMVPTPMAQNIITPVRQALQLLRVSVQ